MLTMAREKITTKHEEIVKYWVSKVSECDLSIDWSEAHERCWRCGYEAGLERCHIVPQSLGGGDIPENYVLLCNTCHHEAPNINDKEFFWDWLKAHATSFYDTYWTMRSMKEYEFIYKVKIEEELIKYNVTDTEFCVFLKTVGLNQCSFHYGHTRLNVSTRTGLLRLFFKMKKQALAQI
jgi:5-methylcytosine-specific restriction endonuclease McrA